MHFKYVGTTFLISQKQQPPSHLVIGLQQVEQTSYAFCIEFVFGSWIKLDRIHDAQETKIISSFLQRNLTRIWPLSPCFLQVTQASSFFFFLLLQKGYQHRPKMVTNEFQSYNFQPTNEMAQHALVRGPSFFSPFQG